MTQQVVPRTATEDDSRRSVTIVNSVHSDNAQRTCSFGMASEPENGVYALSYAGKGFGQCSAEVVERQPRWRFGRRKLRDRKYQLEQYCTPYGMALH